MVTRTVRARMCVRVCVCVCVCVMARTGIQAAVEGADEVEPRRVEQRHVVSRVQLRLVHQHAADALGALVQLDTRHLRCGLALQHTPRNQPVKPLS